MTGTSLHRQERAGRSVVLDGEVLREDGAGRSGGGRGSPEEGPRLEPAGRGEVDRWQPPQLAAWCTPRDGVGEDPPDVGMVVDGVVLVARAEVDDLPVAPPEGAAAAKDLSAREGADEHQLVGCRDVEVLAVHLLLRDHDRVGD